MSRPGYLGPPLRIDADADKKPGVRNAWAWGKSDIEIKPAWWWKDRDIHPLPPTRVPPIRALPPEFDKFSLPGYGRQLGCCDDLHGHLGELGACGRENVMVVVEESTVPRWVWIVAAVWAGAMLLKRGGR